MARSRYIGCSVAFLYPSQPKIWSIHIFTSGKYVLLTLVESNLRSFSWSIPVASICHSSANHDMERDAHQRRVHSVCDEHSKCVLL